MAEYLFTGRGPWTEEMVIAGLNVLFGKIGRGPRGPGDFYRRWPGINQMPLATAGLERKESGAFLVYIVPNSPKLAEYRAILEQWEKENEDPSPSA